jgi:regulator of CtrA degradation
MPASDATNERYRLGSKEICLGGGSDGTDLLPLKLQDLLARSDNLYRRIARLDDVLFADGLQRAATPAVHGQLNRLAKAFGGEDAA